MKLHIFFSFSDVIIHCLNTVSNININCYPRDINITWANWGRTAPDSQVCPFGHSHKNDVSCKHGPSLSVSLIVLNVNYKLGSQSKKTTF